MPTEAFLPFPLERRSGLYREVRVSWPFRSRNSTNSVREILGVNDRDMSGGGPSEMQANGSELTI